MTPPAVSVGVAPGWPFEPTEAVHVTWGEILFGCKLWPDLVKFGMASVNLGQLSN